MVGAGLSYAFAYGVPAAAMAGSAVGSVLDSTEWCPTGKINRIAGDIAYLSSFIPAEQAARYVAVVWNGAWYLLGYGGAT